MRAFQNYLSILTSILILTFITVPAQANEDLCKALFLSGKPPQVSDELSYHVFETLLRELRSNRSSEPEILRLMITTESSLAGRFIQNIEAAAKRHAVELPADLREFSVQTAGYNFTAVGPSDKLASFLIELRQISPTLHVSLGRPVELNLPSLDLNKELFVSHEGFSFKTLIDLEKHLSGGKPSYIDLPNSNDALVAMTPFLFGQYASRGLLSKSGLKYFTSEVYQSNEVNNFLAKVAQSEGVLAITTEGISRAVIMPFSLLKAFQNARKNLISKPLSREEQLKVLKCANCVFPKAPSVLQFVIYKDPKAMTASVLEADLSENRPAALTLQGNQPYFLALHVDFVKDLDITSLNTMYFKATFRELPAHVKEAIDWYSSGDHLSKNYAMKIATVAGVDFESIRAKQVLDGLLEDSKHIAGVITNQLLERHSGQPKRDLFLLIPLKQPGQTVRQSAASRVLETPRVVEASKAVELAESTATAKDLAAETNKQPPTFSPVLAEPAKPATVQVAPSTEEEEGNTESTPTLKVYNGKRTVIRSLLEQDLTKEKPAAIVFHRKTPHSLILLADAVGTVDLSILAADYSKISGRQLPPQIAEAIKAYQANDKTKLAKYAGTDFDTLKAVKTFDRIFDDTNHVAVMTTSLVPQYQGQPKRDLFLIITLKEAGELLNQDAPIEAPQKVAPKRPATTQEASLSKAVTDYYFQGMTEPDDNLALTPENPAMVLKWHSKPALLVLAPEKGYDLTQFIEAYAHFTGVKPSAKVIESFSHYLKDSAGIERLSPSAMAMNNYKSTTERLLKSQTLAMFTNSATSRSVLIVPVTGETIGESAPAKAREQDDVSEPKLKLTQMITQRLFQNFNDSDSSAPYALNETRPGVVITRYTSNALVAFNADVLSKLSVEQVETLYRKTTGVSLPAVTHDFFSGKRAIRRLSQSTLTHPTTYATMLRQIEESGEPIVFTSTDASGREQVAFFLLPYNHLRSPEALPAQADVETTEVPQISVSGPTDSIQESQRDQPVETPATLDEMLESWMEVIIALQSGSPIEEKSSQHLLELGALIKDNPELAQTDEVRVLAYDWAEMLSQKGASLIEKNVMDAISQVMSKAGIVLDYGLYMSQPESLIADVRYQLNTKVETQVSFSGRALRRLLSDSKTNKLLLKFFEAVAVGIAENRNSNGIHIPRHRVKNIVEAVFMENNTPFSLYGCQEGNHIAIKQLSSSKITAETALAKICE